MCTMSQFLTSLDESDGLFDFNVEEFNTVTNTSSVDNTSNASQSAAPTSKRRQHSKNLELDRYVAQNRKILISIAPGQDKAISPHVVCFNNTISVLMRDTFSVHFLKCIDVTLEYIEVIKISLLQWFVLDFTDQTLLGLLSIKCSPCGRSSRDKTTAISRSLMILNRLVPTHPQIEQSGARLALPLRPLPHSTISGEL
ncbi:(R)-mandelonitrile lyase 1-like [Cucumis melo var. makuwa]|uniref:(R)-mandelonitrile lyase 1-like n=1 Tax=Cucumis melo var. makuwa TaxID=1194695 RepID=A0A5D3DED2_CUCMM|nr:(R)-mandelonitrile lyase 1-like [Cucumis melo var. makuwa]TYK22037.1 (R)-mandelonitrile lyase 1-like [Cucumis melo var. makuwa]